MPDEMEQNVGSSKVIEEWTACEHQDQSLSDNIFSCDVLQSGVESLGVFRCSVGCKSGGLGSVL